jgi:hypothetical protein
MELVDLTFVEEPLGLRADQGYGYMQVEFGERIGPEGRYEILRKLGWGMNVSGARHAIQSLSVLIVEIAQASVWLARDHVYVNFAF